MNSKAVSLPDLVRERTRNTVMSLTEGFAGGTRGNALATTALNTAYRPTVQMEAGSSWAGGDDGITSALGKVLPIYYRTRQIALSTERAGYRIPKHVNSELRAQERNVAQELRPLHPTLFQRLDEPQLDRLLRAMPFMKLKQGRWILGDNTICDPWPAGDPHRGFILLYGRIELFPDATGHGDKIPPGGITRGAVFGERRFQLCDELMHAWTCGAAYCPEPCIVGCLTTKVLEIAFADRAFGNRRIAQGVKSIPAFARITQPEQSLVPEEKEKDTKESLPLVAMRTEWLKVVGGFGEETKEKYSFEVLRELRKSEESNAISGALRDLSKIATAIHLRPGQEVLCDGPLDETLLIVAKGGIEIRGDITLTERLDTLPAKKVRVRVFVEKAERLAGDSMWDKLDPYTIVKLGEHKRFQTHVESNAGPNPKWEYSGVLTYQGEKQLDFTVMDRDKFSADDLCGNGTLILDDEWPKDGWKGVVDLFGKNEGPAGKLHVAIKYDYEKVNPLLQKPKQKVCPDIELFRLKVQDSWGHEQLMLGHLFRKTLEQADRGGRYAMSFSRFKIIGASAKGVQDWITCWKVSRTRFMEFVRHTGREKQFIQACRVQALEKQTLIKEKLQKLVARWEQEEQCNLLRSETMGVKKIEEAMDPSHFRIAYRGVKCHLTVRNALNLAGGGWFDKLDPYAILKFRGAKAEVRTSVLQDAGSDPVWDSEGTLIYQGETAIEISVWDYDKYSANDLIATGVLQVEQFCQGGFEGMIPLALPGNKKKKNMKQMMIVIGVMWDLPKVQGDLGATESTRGPGAMGATV